MRNSVVENLWWADVGVVAIEEVTESGECSNYHCELPGCVTMVASLSQQPEFSILRYRPACDTNSIDT